MTSEAPKLLPCPFCGSIDLDVMNVSGECHVFCYDCESSSSSFDGSNDGDRPDPHRANDYAIEAWNTRDNSHALAMVAAALEPWNAVRGDSQGITGYHLNGDVAEWDELDLPETPTDAQAALDAMLKAERVKALREAADMIDCKMKQSEAEISRLGAKLSAQKKPSVNYALRRAELNSRMSCRDAILALIKKETGHE